MIGVNLAGAEFGETRGTYGDTYIYPGEAQLDYYHSKGIDLIRLPFKWERMQPTLNGPLDPAELARLETFLQQANERGMQVVVDLHNFGRYDGNVIGSEAAPITAFQDFWQKLAAALVGHDNIAGYGLMNEPHHMGGAEVWPAAAQAAVDAIRQVDQSHTIIVAGDSWSGAPQWKSANANLLVDDPAHNVVYEAHVYFDRWNQGVYEGTYDEEGAYPMIGVDSVRPFLEWLEENNVRGYIGEYGVPDDDPRWLPVISNLLEELNEHGISSTYWAGGPWWADYPLAIEPRDGEDQPQLAVLLDHIVPGDEPFPWVDLGTSELTAGDDSITAIPGDEFIDALAGNDTIIFDFALTDATVSYIDHRVIVDGPHGRKNLSGFQSYEFTDGTVNEDDGNPLIADLFYYSQNHDVWEAHVDADAHYNAFGWQEGRDPSAFFSTGLYLSLYQDVRAANVSPLTHFDAWGWNEGRLPSLAFSPAHYLQDNPDVAAAQVDPLGHFLQYGGDEQRAVQPASSLLAGNTFDFVYYLRHNPDVAAANVDPLLHFQSNGWKEGRDPNALFDTSGYLEAYADVAAANVNPLDHFNEFGWKEGRDPSTVFDTTDYLVANQDVAAADVNPLLHYLQYGQDEGRTAFNDGIWG